MLSIKKIFASTDEQLDQQLIKYSDTNNYKTRSRKIKNVIINAYNNDDLNEQDSLIVGNDNFDSIINQKPETYLDFQNLRNYSISKLTKRINITIDKKLLINWNFIKFKIDLKENLNNIIQLFLNSQYLFSLDINLNIKFWDLKTLNYVSSIDNLGINSKIHCNDEYLFYIDNNFNINMTLLSNLKNTKIKSKIKNIKNLFVNNDNLILYSKNKFEIHSIKKNKLLKDIDLSFVDNIISIIATEKYFIIAYNLNIIKIHDIETLKVYNKITHDNAIKSIILNNEYLFISSLTNKIKVISLNNFQVVKELYSQYEYDYFHLMSLNKECLFITSSMGNIYMFNLKTLTHDKIIYNNNLVFSIISNNNYLFFNTVNNSIIKVYEKD